MSVLNKYNSGKAFNFDGDKERDFISLKELVEKYSTDKEFTVHALFINTKSHFGDAPVVYTDDYMVNAPSHMVDTVREMMKDDELVDLVNDRKVAFKIYSYKNNYGTNYSIEWIEK